MTVELVDGRAGKPHIDGDDLGDFKLGFCGGGYVLGTGDVLKATQPSANKVTVATGSAVMPLTGRHVRVTAPETVAVTSGTQGQKRRDIVVLRASTGSGVESASLVCLRGTPVSYGTPADPAVPEGDLALYRVTLDGASVSKPEPVFKVLRSAADLEELWDSVSHEVTSGNIVVRAQRRGGVVSLDFLETGVSGSAGTRESSVELPAEFAPASPTRAFAAANNNPDINAWGKVDSAGVVRLYSFCRAAYGGEAMEFHVAYIAAR